MPTPIAVPTPATGILDTQYNAAITVTFQQQMSIAISSIALLILAEDPTEYTDDAARKKLAGLVIQNPMIWAQQAFCYAAVADMTTNSASTDTAIVARVAAIWSAVAVQYA